MRIKICCLLQLENIIFKKICLLYYLNNEIFICVVCYVIQSRSCQSAQLTSTAIAMTMGHSGMLGHLLPLLHYTRHRLHCLTDWAVSVCQNDQNYSVKVRIETNRNFGVLLLKNIFFYFNKYFLNSSLLSSTCKYFAISCQLLLEKCWESLLVSNFFSSTF